MFHAFKTPLCLLNVLSKKYFLCRQWRKLGEDPCLWAKFKLGLMMYRTSAPPDHPNSDPPPPLCLPQDVLSLRRLQSLEYFHLNNRPVGWNEIILNHPSIRKLSLAMPIARSLSEDEYANLAAVLVKFEEVDLTGGTGVSYLGLAKKVLPLILKSLVSASALADSKLKKLSISDVDENANAAVLAEARKIFAVKILQSRTEQNTHIANIMLQNALWPHM